MSFPKYQTVAWWIEQLQEMPNKKALVKIATEPFGKAKAMLSIYEGAEKKATVWIDVGDPNNEEF